MMFTIASTGVVTSIAAGSATIRASITSPSITSNACVVTVTAGAITGTNLWKMDFNTVTQNGPSFFTTSPNGQQGWNWTGGNMDVIADPTGSSRGNVLRIHYVLDAISQFDDNRNIVPAPYPLFTRTLGNETWGTCDFYLDPATCRMDDSGPLSVQRKLTYFGWNGTGPHSYAIVLKMFGPQFVVDTHPPQDFTVAGGTGENCYIALNVLTVAAGTWYTVKFQQILETAYGAGNGVLRIWVNGVSIYNRTDMRWSNRDPSGNPTDWSDLPTANYLWTDWPWGDQSDSSTAVNEYRYLDNISFATSEAAL